MYRMIRHSQRRTQPASARPSQLRFSSEIRTAGTVIVVVLLAAITKGPYFVLGLSLAAAGIPLPSWLDTLAMWMYWTGCAVNPMIYAVRNPNVGIILNLRRSGSHHRYCNGGARAVRRQGQAYVIPAVAVATPSSSATSRSKHLEQVSSALTLDHVDVSTLACRSDSIPSVLLFYADSFNPRKGSGISAVTNSTITTTL